MLEYGLNLLFFSLSLSGVPSLGATLSKLPRFPTSPYAWYGFRNTEFLTGDVRDCGEGCDFASPVALAFGAGRNDSSRTLTKLLGNRPTALGSLRSLPVHHRPSPAFRASIRSPSMNPRSFLVSPPQEYVARHQQGKLGGRSGVPPIAMTL